MDTTQNKILAAVDGSDQSLDAVRYLSKVISPDNMKVTLFYVQRKINDAFWDVGISTAFSERMANLAAWESQQEKAVKEFMDTSRQILLDAGFTPQAVQLNIHQCQTGIARDIIQESKKGYRAVAAGRKGLSKLKDIVLGSIAYKLIEKIHHTPMWVIGGNPEAGKVLLAMDTSEGAMKAVDHVGAVLGRSDCEVQLLHVIREVHPYSWLYGGEEIIHSKLDKGGEAKWWDHVRAEMDPVLDDAKHRLINAGFDAKRVTTQFITGVSSRAGAIVEQAEAGGYGTIVVGRRGLSKVQEFLMGRVSNKVLHLAQDKAVWIVD
ncbi:MAG: universal stress protein [Thermodesulfobacteriota bacterium]